MPFESITGHRQQKQILLKALQNRRIAHAYLFEGPEGIGKKLVALAFARMILCHQGCGCGHCNGCYKVDHGIHPDLHLLDSQDATIKIEQIRELQQQLALRPLESPYRICLIDGAEQMTTGAANALLKTLEEPQQGTIIILLSGYPEKLLTTIRSRCQRLPFQKLSRAQLTDILSEQLDYDSTHTAILAALSDGSFKKALGQKQELYLEKRKGWIQALSALSAGSNIPTLELAEELSADKENQQDILDIFQAYLRDILLLKFGRPEADLVNLDLRELLQRDSQRFTIEALQTKLTAISTARFHLQRNVNRQLAFEVMLLRVASA